MTDLEYKILALLVSGDKASAEIYEKMDKNAGHIRRVLIKFIDQDVVRLSQQFSGGPGRPMNVYTLTKTGKKLIEAHEQEIEDLKGE